MTVEITEGLLTEGSDKALFILEQIHSAGAQIAIDDFGTGYSSLSYLTKFPIDILKIDRSFTQKIGYDIAAETLTETILGLAHKLGFKVIAEGVEEEQQLQYLYERGCAFAQGYHLGRPQSQEDLTALLSKTLAVANS